MPTSPFLVPSGLIALLVGRFNQMPTLCIHVLAGKERQLLVDEELNVPNQEMKIM